MRVLWSLWQSWLPQYTAYEHRHKTLFYHRSFRWLFFNIQWDLRDYRVTR